MVQSPSNSISMNTRDWDNEPKCNYYSVYIIMPWILVSVYLHKQGHVHNFDRGGGGWGMKRLEKSSSLRRK